MREGTCGRAHAGGHMREGPNRRAHAGGHMQKGTCRWAPAGGHMQEGTCGGHLQEGHAGGHWQEGREGNFEGCKEIDKRDTTTGEMECRGMKRRRIGQRRNKGEGRVKQLTHPLCRACGHQRQKPSQASIAAVVVHPMSMLQYTKMHSQPQSQVCQPQVYQPQVCQSKMNLYTTHRWVIDQRCSETELHHGAQVNS